MISFVINEIQGSFHQLITCILIQQLTAVNTSEHSTQPELIIAIDIPHEFELSMIAEYSFD